MRLYVIGGEGQVARALREAAAVRSDLVFGHSSRAEVDLHNPSTIEAALDAFRPDVVVNPAAYTAVDKAEIEPEQAFAVNRDGAGAVAAAAARHDVPVIHFSTDYVYDGRKPDAYVESDPVAPQGVYGQSKLAGEYAVAAANPKHMLLRTSWVYAPFGSNFVRTMLRLASECDRLRVVSDQIGSPTYAPDIADAVLQIASMVARTGWRSDFAGITHLAGPDTVSWFDFARNIIQQARLRGGRRVVIDPILTSEYPTVAARPANSRLSTTRLAATFDIRLQPMETSLAHCLDRLLQDRMG